MAADWARVSPGSAQPLGNVHRPLPVRTRRNSIPLRFMRKHTAATCSPEFHCGCNRIGNRTICPHDKDVRPCSFLARAHLGSLVSYAPQSDADDNFSSEGGSGIRTGILLHTCAGSSRQAKVLIIT